MPNFTAIDPTSIPQVKSQLFEASSGATMDSPVQIATGKTLQGKYILRGTVESMVSRPSYTEDRKQFYAAEIKINLQLVDVESSATLLTKSVSATNGLMLAPEECKGSFTSRIPCEAKRRATEHSVEEFNRQGARVLRTGDGDNPTKAILAAVNKINEVVTDFMNDGVLAGKIK
jgi:hypothetical protein